LPESESLACWQAAVLPFPVVLVLLVAEVLISPVQLALKKPPQVVAEAEQKVTQVASKKMLKKPWIKQSPE